MTIGELERATGVPTKTIRYYEASGVLPPATRAANGYRSYDARSVQVLRFIKRGRDLGFSLDEVGELLALWGDADRNSAEVKQLTMSHLASVEAKIEQLQSMRRAILDLSDRCHGDDRPDCPILDDLAGPAPADGDHHDD